MANSAQQATDRKYGGGHVAPCGHYVNNGAEKCHVCYAATVQAQASPRRIVGEPWIDVAASRMRAGEPEVDVMRDYGYMRDNAPAKGEGK